MDKRQDNEIYSEICFYICSCTVFYIKIEVKEVHQTLHMKKGLLPNLFSIYGRELQSFHRKSFSHIKPRPTSSVKNLV